MCVCYSNGWEQFGVLLMTTSQEFMLMIEQFWSVLQPLIIMGITAGVVLAVVFGSIRIGWKFAPWIVALGLLILFIN